MIFSFVFLFPAGVSAKVILSENEPVEIGKDEVINDDLFVGAERVEINGIINGDVYAGAETVRIGGVINGNLHVGAGSFYLNGKVLNSVYVGAGNVNLTGATVGNSLIVGAGNVNVDENSLIGGSIIAGSGTINLNAPVKRNVFIGAGNVDLNSKIDGEVRLGGGSISIGPKTKIAKDFYYAVNDDQKGINISESAAISGKVQKMESKIAVKKDFELPKRELTGAFKAVGAAVNIFSFIGALLVGLLALKLYPKVFSVSSDFVSKAFFKSLGLGFLIAIVAIPALLVIALTGIGFPLAGVILLLLILALYFSKIVVGLSLGVWLSEKFNWKKMSTYMMFVFGLVVVYLLKALPYIGFVFSLVFLWSGLGALVMYHKTSILPKK